MKLAWGLSGDVLEAVAWPALLLAGGMVLLQVHAIPYWQARAGLALGVLWSLQLEGTALWLLYQPGANYRRMGMVTAAVLIGVPLWQISQPVVKHFDAVQSGAQSTADAGAVRAESRREDRIGTRKARVETYRRQLNAAMDALAAAVDAEPAQQRRLAQARAGAQARYDAAENALEAAQDAEDRPAPIPTGIASIGWLDWLRAAADVLPGAASLILFQWMNVTAILALSRYRHGLPAPKPPPPPTEPDPPPRRPAPKPESLPEAETIVPTVVSAQPAAPETASQPEMKPAGESPVSVKPLAPTVAGPRVTRPLRLADEMTIRRLQHELAGRIRASGGTAADWCRAEKVAPRDLSFLLNHFERVSQGKDIISVPKLAELVARYLRPAGEGTGA